MRLATWLTCVFLFLTNDSFLIAQFDVASGDALYEQGEHCIERNEYQLAAQKFSKSRNIYLVNRQWEKYSIAYLYYMDCLLKLNKLRDVEQELEAYGHKLDSISTRIDTFNFVESKIGQKRFQVKLELKSGRPWVAESLILDLRNQYNNLKDQNNIIAYLAADGLSLAEAKYQQGNFQASIEENSNALQLIIENNLESKYDSQGVMIIPYLFNADSYRALGNFRQVEANLNKASDLLRKFSTKIDERTVQVYNHSIMYYLEVGKQDSVSKYLALLTQLNKDKRYQSDIEYYKALFELKFGSLVAAESAVSKAAKIIIRDKGEGDFLLSNLMMHLATRYFDAGQFEDALKISNSHIVNILKYSSKVAGDSNQILLTTSIVELFRLKSISLLNLFQINGQRALLDEAWLTASECNEIIQFLRSSYNARSDRMFLIEKSYDHFETALNIAFAYYQMGQKHWLDTAFLLMEQSKALSLLDDSFMDKVLSNEQISVQIQREISQIFTEISNLEHDLLLMEQNKFLDQNEMMAKQRKLHDLKQERQKHLDEIANKGIHLNFMLEEIIPKWIDVKLNSEQDSVGFIEYFLGKNALFTLMTDGVNQSFNRQEIGPNFASELNNFIANIVLFDRDKQFKRIDTYIENANVLYEQLIGFVDFTLPQRLLIVPDGVLRQLPFSALLDQLPADARDVPAFPFLLKKYSFSYCYSYTHQLKFLSVSKLGKIKVDALAPSFPSFWRSQYPTEMAVDSLYFSIDEVDKLCVEVSCRKRIGLSATRAAFIEMSQVASHGNILHLSTHAVANEDIGSSSFVRFSSEEPTNDQSKLLANDIAQMKLPYHLAVLSACETAAGQSMKGEGVIGLSRSFFQAGVSSLIASLWSVNDLASSEIQVEFYRQLKKGMTKDRALQLAQIFYLEKMNSKSKQQFAHPFYWAAMIPVGDMGAFEVSDLNFLSTPMLFLIAMSFLILIVVWRKRMRLRKDMP